MGALISIAQIQSDSVQLALISIKETPMGQSKSTPI
jgi:hypothetical protein